MTTEPARWGNDAWLARSSRVKVQRSRTEKRGNRPPSDQQRRGMRLEFQLAAVFDWRSGSRPLISSFFPLPSPSLSLFLFTIHPSSPQSFFILCSSQPSSSSPLLLFLLPTLPPLGPLCQQSENSESLAAFLRWRTDFSSSVWKTPFWPHSPGEWSSG